MNRSIAKLMTIFLLTGSLLAQAASEPFALIVGSSVIGTRENSKQDVHLGFNTLFNHLISDENIQCNFKDYDKSDILMQSIKNKEVNAMFGSPLEYIQSESWLFDAYLISGVLSKQYKSKILILIRNDSEIKTIEQLNGKKIAVQRGVIQDLGGLYLETVLLEKKLPVPAQYFSEIVKTETSNVALVNLFFKKVDVALMSESEFNIASELNPQMRLQIRAIESSDSYINFVAATTKDVPSDKREAIKNTILAIEKTAKGRNMLKLLKIDGFQVIHMDELTSVRTLVEKNRQLKVKLHAQ